MNWIKFYALDFLDYTRKNFQWIKFSRLIQARIENIKNSETNIFTFSHQICLHLTFDI